MELLKVGAVRKDIQIGDVTFVYRTEVTRGDRFFLSSEGILQRDGKVTMSFTEYYRAIVKRFVVDWRGVTEDGKPAPYSYENLERLPADPSPSEPDLIFDLGLKIANDLGLFGKKDDAAKND